MPPVRKNPGFYKIVILIHSYNLASVEVGASVRSYSHKGSNPGNSIPVGCNKGDRHPKKKIYICKTTTYLKRKHELLHRKKRKKKKEKAQSDKKPQLHNK